MPKHLFLTGRKHVGKSTLLQKVIADVTGPVGGFYTRRSAERPSQRPSVHLLSASTGTTPTAENLLFYCGVTDSHVTERFEKLGIAALKNTGHLIVMDELGSHEENAKAFQARIMELLDGDIPIIGVLQQADSLFLQTVARHPQVELLTVTEENRDVLAAALHGWQSEKKSDN